MTDRASVRLPAGVVRPIEFTGLEIPLMALSSEPSAVLLGNRRAAAIKEMAHFDEVPILVVRTATHLKAWCDADRALEARFGEPGLPWTWRQRATALNILLANLEGFRGGSGTNRPGSPTAILARYFGVHEIQLRNATYLLRFELADGPDRERATEALDLVEAGEVAPQSAYRRVREGRMVQNVTPYTPKPKVSAAAQERALGQVAATLAGVTYGLRQLGDIDPAIPAETRAALAAPLADARQVLTRVVRQLTNKGDDE